MYKEKMINLETGEEIWRDYTADEIAEVERFQTEAAERAAKEAEATAARAALLEKLGLTQEEAKVLLS